MSTSTNQPAAGGPDIPLGATRLRVLRGHTDMVGRIAWSPDGRMLASAGRDATVRLWDGATGEPLGTIAVRQGTLCTAIHPAGRLLAVGGGKDDPGLELRDLSTGEVVRRFEGPTRETNALTFDGAGALLASAGDDQVVRIWDATTGHLLHELGGFAAMAFSCAFSPDGTILAAGSGDHSVRLWDVSSGRPVVVNGHADYVRDVAFDPTGSVLASASDDRTIKLWDATSGRLLRTLEGHTEAVCGVSFAAGATGAALLASLAVDSTIRLWRCDTWEPIATLPHPNRLVIVAGLAFHPTAPILAAVASGPSGHEYGREIHQWGLDLPRLLAHVSTPAVAYTSAKIVLVGDSGAGKTGLGWRLAKGEFKEHPSTHGQQFWPLEQLRWTRPDGTECEAVLWDLAGQPDYRLIHALFLDDADLALVLFDPTRDDEALRGVEFWLKQLQVCGQPAGPTPAAPRPAAVLIAARADRGAPRLTAEDIEIYCRQRGIRGYVRTSALAGEGVEELAQLMREVIPWHDKPATVTTVTFKRIKDYVLGLKDSAQRDAVILTSANLRRRLELEDPAWRFTDDELLTAVGHLANHGYVVRLTTSRGEQRILLTPELLNNLASSLVLEARRHERGLGSLEEQRLLAGGYPFPELTGLSQPERDVLLDSAVVLFLGHNICFRETDPLTSRAYLVFPELINLRKPQLPDDRTIDDGPAYTVAGPVENVFASLVVLLGYTHTFTRTAQWRHHARYEVGDGLVCGFRQEGERDGELDLVLYYGTNVGAPVRTLFQSLFEAFLARRNLTVRRFEPVACGNGHPLNRGVVREHVAKRKSFAFCPDCGGQIALGNAEAPIQLTRKQTTDMEVQRRAADLRSRFEQAVFRLKTFAAESQLAAPTCFISYAWGDPAQEQWVERILATDLLKAGIDVVLDRWENARVGASVSRFVERIAECDRVVVVGTRRYRVKYDNREPMGGFVVAAEGDVIGSRMLDSEARKETVLPVLLEGTTKESLPPILHSRVYADFRSPERYVGTAFDLILSLYKLSVRHSAVVELRQSLADDAK